MNNKNIHITNAEFEFIKQSLDRIHKILITKQRNNPDEVFFDNQEFIQIMNISKRTAQEWRNNNIIAYSQIGMKFYYKLSDILTLLNKFYKPIK
jgi:hypothetical protein